MPETHRTQLPAPPASICPTCGRAATNSYAREHNGIITRGYVDAREHLWTVRFIGGAA